MRPDQLLPGIKNFEIGPDRHLGNDEILRKDTGAHLTSALKLHRDLLAALFGKHRRSEPSCLTASCNNLSKKESAIIFFARVFAENRAAAQKSPSLVAW